MEKVTKMGERQSLKGTVDEKEASEEYEVLCQGVEHKSFIPLTATTVLRALCKKIYILK